MSLDYIKKGPKLSFDKLKSNLPSDIQFTWVDDKDVFHKVTPNHKFNPNKQYVMNGNEMDENGREIGYLYLCFTQQGKLFGGTSYGLRSCRGCGNHVVYKNDKRGWDKLRRALKENRLCLIIRQFFGVIFKTVTFPV